MYYTYIYNYILVITTDLESHLSNEWNQIQLDLNV